ncbi:MAG: 4Fe-4S dicluster domain-containing protein [Candidatus Cloacimonetes bacterium]|nr:4Fe-4S dicluster domain-containing protein [Candidatus Cloacimonadota bacterium]MBL7086698.1 4Fe-4S dicluster domain-containing protein [Candidatus Cloacimonadota bacterium]
MANKITITSENVEFLRKVEELSGEIITLCDQCGTCSAGCPMVGEMDITPSQMVRNVQLGITDVLDTKAMWLCASCFTCTVRCPRGLDLSKIAEALRQIKLRKAVDYIDINKLPEEDLKELPQIALISGFRKFTG